LNKSIGIPGYKISVLPAFLPPKDDDDSVNDLIKIELLKLKRNVKKIALVSGIASENYNFPLVVNVFERLKKQNIELGLVVVFYGGADDEVYKNHLISKIPKIDGIIFFNNLPPADFIYLMKNIDIFIRPTDIDGASLALREAIYFKKQIVASNSLARPAGIQIFKNRDEDDLEKKILAIIQNDDIGVSSHQLINTGDQIINIYKNLLIQ